jgi:hypothetical protein
MDKAVYYKAIFGRYFQMNRLNIPSPPTAQGKREFIKMDVW